MIGGLTIGKYGGGNPCGHLYATLGSLGLFRNPFSLGLGAYKRRPSASGRLGHTIWPFLEKIRAAMDVLELLLRDEIDSIGIERERIPIGISHRAVTYLY